MLLQFLTPFLVALATAVLLAVLVWIVARRSARKSAQTLERLRNDWANPIERSRDFGMYEEFLDARGVGSEDDRLDDQTWLDLNLASVFVDLDRTYSLPGEVALYRMVRVPLQDRNDLAQRDTAIEVFQSDVQARESILLQLSSLGRTRFDRGILELLWNDPPRSSRLAPAFGALVFMVVGLIVSSSVLGVIGSPLAAASVTLLVLTYATNFGIHYWLRRGLDVQIQSIRYLSKMIVTSRMIADADTHQFESMRQNLREYALAVKAIPSATSVLVPERGPALELVDLVQEHLSILFLVEVRAFQTVLKVIRIHQRELREMFHALGELDALQAVGSYREGLDKYCKPEFIEGPARLEIENVHHPLIDLPVPNSVSISSRGWVVTGTNMSGKSTFLRTLGLSAVMAQSVYTCCASKYRGSLLRVFSSMNPSDDLISGKSFYFAEAERLLSIIRASEQADPVLCIVDELLRGTNSAERLAASEAILSYLSAKNSMVIVATHDIELADRLEATYDQYHFGDDADVDGLHFDYRLREGRATTTNAIELLEHLDYPMEIVRRARSGVSGNTAEEQPE